jgi:hypothetical protein
MGWRGQWKFEGIRGESRARGQSSKYNFPGIRMEKPTGRGAERLLKSKPRAERRKRIMAGQLYPGPPSALFSDEADEETESQAEVKKKDGFFAVDHHRRRHSDALAHENKAK